MLILISYTLSFILLSLLRKYFSIEKKIVIFSIVYIVVIIVNQSYDSYLDYQLNSFDLDGDGIFGGKEISPEQELAMDAVMHDTARTFIWFTGIAYAFVYVLFSYLKAKYVIAVILIGAILLGINSLNSYERRTNKIKEFSRENNIVRYKNLLMYQDDSNVVSIKKTWIDAKQYCHNLTLSNYKNLRLPSSAEQYNIADNSQYYSYIIPPFKNIYPDIYWTSEIQNNDYIWIINFRNKSKYFIYSKEKHLVRCVKDIYDIPLSKTQK